MSSEVAQPRTCRLALRQSGLTDCDQIATAARTANPTPSIILVRLGDHDANAVLAGDDGDIGEAEEQAVLDHAGDHA